MVNDENRNKNIVSIEVFISRRDVIERDESVGVDPGKYLYIETNQKDQAIYTSIERFVELYEKAKKGISAVSRDSQIGLSSDVLNKNTSQKPNFQELMSYLADKIGINCSSFQNNDELIILSDIALYLELPWEDIADKEIFVFRKIIGNNNKESPKSKNQLLLLMSHAHEGIGEDLKEKMDDEIKSIYNLLLKNEQQSFRVEGIFLLKHTTKNSLQSLHWKDYNYLHFIMHGTPNGMLCLEKQDKVLYKYPDCMSIDEFLQIINGNSFNLFFLSFCYSGGGVIDINDNSEENLAFKIVKGGFSKYAIGYSYPVGEFSANFFSVNFYDNLSIGCDIKQSYKQALRKSYQEKLKEYIPLLYLYN